MPPKECFEHLGSLETFARFGIENIRSTNLQGLSRKQRSLLDLAVRTAEASDVTQKHGAVLVKGGRVLSVGMNKWRNRDMILTVNEYSDALTTHAEQDALSRVKDARGAVIYIARVGKAGEERMSRPCEACAKALMDAGVKQIVYTIG
jgi:deoxycytidylate deaminase